MQHFIMKFLITMLGGIAKPTDIFWIQCAISGMVLACRKIVSLRRPIFTTELSWDLNLLFKDCQMFPALPDCKFSSVFCNPPLVEEKKNIVIFQILPYLPRHLHWEYWLQTFRCQCWKQKWVYIFQDRYSTYRIVLVTSKQQVMTAD